MTRLLLASTLIVNISFADTKLKSLADSNNAFGVSLFQKVEKRTEKGNRFLSPLSAFLALSMLQNGAEETTAQEISEVLHSEGRSVTELNRLNKSLMKLLNSNKDFALSTANSVWGREGIQLKKTFTTNMEKFYGATVRTLDFALPSASQIINGWVNDETKGRIPTIVPEQIPGDAVLYLINATYFKAEWANKFSSGLTFNRPFTLKSGKKVQVPTMSEEMGDYSFLETREELVLELPYQGDKISMLVVMPAEGLKFDDYVANLSPHEMGDWMEQLFKAEPVNASLTLPKIELSYEETLNDALKTMGMPRAFDRTAAELQGLAASADRLFVSNVKQKTFVKVDEEGTEAAAATAVEVGAESAIVVDKDIRIDRPFLFSIVHKETGAILFLGAIEEPEGGKLPERN